MIELTAVCTPNSHPHPDGRVEHGYQLNVIALDDQLTTLVTVDLPDWDRFRPASAGHRLIEVGYMIRPGIDRADMNGWRREASGYTVPVVRLDEGGRPTGEQDLCAQVAEALWRTCRLHQVTGVCEACRTRLDAVMAVVQPELDALWDRVRRDQHDVVEAAEGAPGPGRQRGASPG